MVSRLGGFRLLVLVLFVVIAALGCGGTSAGEPIFVRASLASTRFSLENGLDVVLHPDPLYRSVAVNVRYEVGSRYDPTARTGLAHLVEHLTFRTKPDGTHDVLTMLERAGSSSHNADTTVDATSYYETVPSQSLPIALFVEAARMARPLDRLDEASFSMEQSVVRNERRERIDDVPYANVGDLAASVLFESSSYGMPTLGLPEDLDRITLADARRFVGRYYRPNNATLVIAGGFDPVRVTALVHELFDAIPPAPIPNAGVFPEPVSRESVRGIMDVGADAPAVVVAWLVPPPGRRGWHEMTLVAEWLASWTKHSLKEAVRRTDARVLSRDEASVFRFYAELAPKREPQAVIAAVDEALVKLSRPELASVLGSTKSRLIAERTLELESIEARARVLQDFLARYDRADSIQAELHEFSTLRHADVASAIEVHLRRGRRVVIEARPTPGAPKAGAWNVRRASE